MGQRVEAPLLQGSAEGQFDGSWYEGVVVAVEARGARVRFERAPDMPESTYPDDEGASARSRAPWPACAARHKRRACTPRSRVLSPAPHVRASRVPALHASLALLTYTCPSLSVARCPVVCFDPR